MVGSVHNIWKSFCYSWHYSLGGHLIRLLVQCSLFAGYLPVPYVGDICCIVDKKRMEGSLVGHVREIKFSSR